VLVLATMMLPGAVTMIPTFLIWNALGQVGTLTPLWAGNLFGSAFYIFLLRQFFRSIPYELSDAARIDGANDFRIWWSVVMPLSKPVLATVGIFAFQSTWDDFLGPLIYMGQNPDMRTLSIGLYQLRNTPGGDNLMPYLMAASMVMMLPILLIFGFGQRYLVRGVTMSGLKG